MKKSIALAVAALALSAFSVNAATTIENFNSWPLGAPADNTTSIWGYTPFGSELAGTEIKSGPTGNYLEVSYSSPADGGSPIIGGTGPFASLGLAQTIDFPITTNLSNPGLAIEFDLKSSAAIADVLFVEIFAESLFLDDTVAPEGQTGFRLGIVGGNQLDLPGGDTWTPFSVLVSDLTTFSADQSVTSRKPNLAKVTKVQITILQTDADLIGDGTIGIDNLAFSQSVPEPSAMMLFGFAGLLGFIKKRVAKK
ncbi:PEP-CTERM sorting domain-containing protein [bacterium]|nr:PEP-CTERM sorting domain-containing protein [bacterium]